MIDLAPRLTIPRFPETARTLGEAKRYFGNRAEQMRVHGFRWRPEETQEVLDKDQAWGAITTYTDHSGHRYQAIFVYENFVGQGRYRDYIQTHRKPTMPPIVTMTDCQIEHCLAHIGLVEGAEYFVLRGITDTPEYRLISEAYGDEPAKRSDVYLMEHIDQGLYILKELGASEEAMRAFCLHPLFQADRGLQLSFNADLSSVSPRAVILAMEYRNIANAYLSRRTLHSLDEIALSPLLEVNQMLIADKLQNMKDFIRFHRGTHPRSVELQDYFLNWIARLDIDPETVRRLCEELAPYSEDEPGPSYHGKINTQVIRAVQTNLIRDSEVGLQIYLQHRPLTMNSYPNMWVPLGGKVEEGKSIFETALTEAQEEGGVSLASRVLFLIGAETAFPDDPGAGKRMYIYPRLIADGNGLEPSVNSPDEADNDGWFTLAGALKLHEEGSLPPGTLKTVQELQALQARGYTSVSQILGQFQRYAS